MIIFLLRLSWFCWNTTERTMIARISCKIQRPLSRSTFALRSKLKTYLVRVFCRSTTWVFLCCLPVQANSGLPMLFVVWPASWFLLLLVIPLEASLASRILKLNYKQSLKLSCIANLYSTVAGIPVTWMCLVMIQHILGADRGAGIQTTREKILAVTLQSPFLLPYGGDSWLQRSATC